MVSKIPWLICIVIAICLVVLVFTPLVTTYIICKPFIPGMPDFFRTFGNNNGFIPAHCFNDSDDFNNFASGHPSKVK
ncbi:MAG: hypothetical protein ISS19_05180 [Bacteroidales bacterium]|nr:hypothetical protein [Bacteroidales bacterium]